MTMRGAEQERGGLTAALGRLTDGFGRLLSDHLSLARLELREDARALGLAVARIAAFVPMILVGYGFLCGALAVLLSQWMGMGWALLIVGAVNALIGGAGAYAAVNKLQQKPVLETTREELVQTKATLTTAARPNGVERRLGA